MASDRVLLIKTDAQIERASDKVAYLGPWCRGSHDALGKTNLLPHHLDSLECVDRLHAISTSLFDFYSRQLAAKLNAIHGMAWSDRAWQILIGPWLTMALDVVIDRFESIRGLAEQPFVIHTDATTFPYGTWVPLDTDDFVNQVLESDQFNEYVFGYILLEAPESRNLVLRHTQDARKPETRKHRSPSLKLAAFDMLRRTGARLASAFPRRVTMVDSYFHPFDQIMLELKLGQIPLILGRNIGGSRQQVDAAARQNMIFRPCVKDALNAVICRLLPELLPILYLEGFSSYLRSVKLQYPRRTRMIVSAHAYSYNEGFRFWTASQIDHDAKLVCVQHGGGYGVGFRWSALEHEFRVADYYCTSGWVSRQKAITVPMPVPKLALSKSIYAATLNNAGKVLWVWRAFRRYPFRIADGSINHDIAEYLEEQRLFGHSLHASIRRQCTLRLRSSDNVWDEQDFARREFPEMELDECKISFKAAAKDSRLWVITYNSTPLLDALVANVPFIVFWNPTQGYNKLSEAAVPHFEKLKRIGVFHESPDSAAHAVNEHFADPARWWGTAEIQQARQAFCEQFAVTRDDWLDIWARKIKEML